jgi:adenylate kinase
MRESTFITRSSVPLPAVLGAIEPAPPLNLVFFGAPGAGKGTQADRFARRYNIPKISTGEMLRRASDERTELGALVCATIHRGELVDDELMIDLVRARLEEPDVVNGFVLDGFPRTVIQARALEALVPHTLVIALDVSADNLLRRLSTRGRADDTIDVIRERLRIYASNTKPVLDYYRSRGIIAVVNGNRGEDAVSDAIEAAIVRCLEPSETS